jgi:hypothetical protein
MKTSAELQQQSFFRKLMYFGLIVVLFTLMTFSSRFAQLFAQAKLFKGADALTKLTVTGKARSLQLNESEQGEADLGGSTVRLALSGSRGFAITIVWLMAIDKQKKHEWNQVDLLVNAISKLQPHFLTPWLFQSWNLAYNVSVESDRVADKYYYISRGIELLAQGERINRGHGVDENGQEFEVGNPDMRFWIGFYYMNKFGTSDEQHTLRSLLQLACINPEKRKPILFRKSSGIDRQAFLDFVKENPMLCRRLRDHLRCSQPEDIVDFLADNFKVFGRYEEIDGQYQLKRRADDQFPVLPVTPETASLASPSQEFGGNFDSYHCAWAWYVYAQQPLPPVEYGKPAAGVPEFDPLRYRLGRQPAPIIFRQYPPRSTTYIADRLQREGWFDESGWTVNEEDQAERQQWFPGQSVVVGNDRRYSSKVIWQSAYEQWQEHGKKHGFLLTEAQRQNLIEESKLFRERYNVQVGQAGPDLQPDQVSEEMWMSFDAARQLWNQVLNENMTNFYHFYYEAEAECNDRTIQVRRWLFDADRLRSKATERAIPLYEKAFSELTGNPAEGKQGLLESFPHFRQDSTIQEDLIETQLDYLGVLERYRGPRMRELLAATNVFVASSFMPNVVSEYWALLYEKDFFGNAKAFELPTLFTLPLIGKDSKDEPWVSQHNIDVVRERKGTRMPGSRPAQAPAGKTPGPGK